MSRAERYGIERGRRFGVPDCGYLVRVVGIGGSVLKFVVVVGSGGFAGGDVACAFSANFFRAFEVEVLDLDASST